MYIRALINELNLTRKITIYKFFAFSLSLQVHLFEIKNFDICLSFPHINCFNRKSSIIEDLTIERSKVL